MNTIKSDNLLVIKGIKAFNDNYIWCIHSNTSQHIALVDPGDAEVCIQFIEENALYTKFMLWCGIQEQLKNLKDSLATPTE